MLKYVISSLFVSILTLSQASAADKIKMYFNNEELTKVIEIYSKATGQKFIIDPGVRGKISIYNQEALEPAEAFNQLSIALATNGFAISKQNDVMVVKSARNVQRDLIEVSSEVPSVFPQRMYTWVATLKHVSVLDLNRDLRILPSRDGEMNVNAAANQIIFTDWATNLNRIAEILKAVDKPVDPATKKLVDASRRHHGPSNGPAHKGPAPKHDEAGKAPEKQ
ncbi:general secretion pathway protein GspD [Bdellovibrio bacteriovorus]|uniref:General secretion pathway protein GspD n=1 Tax=Bdellovibrio bacteriovorus TaxID=959 RepID=A0A1Z3N4L1_BDEBC|nr:general secretion pathway protein GspD [Bdellovibrio bacteriovorus]ASD62414.1 general secretion pathway protein GspD [Bdellovibrio bacteriovorus]